jgi:hypothetical protein
VYCCSVSCHFLFLTVKYLPQLQHALIISPLWYIKS